MPCALLQTGKGENLEPRLGEKARTELADHLAVFDQELREMIVLVEDENEAVKRKLRGTPVRHIVMRTRPFEDDPAFPELQKALRESSGGRGVVWGDQHPEGAVQLLVLWEDCRMPVLAKAAFAALLGGGFAVSFDNELDAKALTPPCVCNLATSTWPLASTPGITAGAVTTATCSVAYGQPQTCSISGTISFIADTNPVTGLSGTWSVNAGSAFSPYTNNWGADSQNVNCPTTGGLASWILVTHVVGGGGGINYYSAQAIWDCNPGS